MGDGLRIPGIDVCIARGHVTNKSNGVVLCWVQDNAIEIFELGPNRSSPGNRDVDAVKADWPCKLLGQTGWFKFSDLNSATVTGTSPDLKLDFFWGSPSASDSISDDDMIQKGGVDPSTTNIERFINRGSAIWWGDRLS